MDFDEMLETWRAQNAAPPYDVDRDALRKALNTEETKARRELRLHRRVLWFFWIFGTGMAVWAGFWIAITIANGWPPIYAITSGASLGMFALGVGAFWVSRGRQAELKRDFGNTLQAEVRRSLALVDYQLFLTRRWTFSILGAACVIVGSGLFSWTVNRSQDIPGSSLRGWTLFTILFLGLIVWGSYKEREERRKTELKLETRQRHLREVLAALDARD
jgi:hypothetical protein